MTHSTHPFGELALIAQIRKDAARQTSSAVRLGIGDDCAILQPPRGSEVLVTTDFTLENRHFRRDLHPAQSVGHRCLARGLSDLAAMGAKPLAAFLSLALPAELLQSATGRRWIEAFFVGLNALAQRCNVPLAGGDTAQSPANLILADITLIGAAPAGKALRRSTAHADDRIYCTGSLGGSAAELQSLFQRNTLSRIKLASPQHPQLYPEPRLAVGAALLRRNLASACLDLSDGLSTDLAHLAAESNLAAEIDLAALPLHPLAVRLAPQQALAAALHGGEDYELLFAAPAAIKVPRQIVGVPITAIGRLQRPSAAASHLTLVHADGRREPLQAGGWQHFAASPPVAE